MTLSVKQIEEICEGSMIRKTIFVAFLLCRTHAFFFNGSSRVSFFFVGHFL